jgi:hypothetical protein
MEQIRAVVVDPSVTGPARYSAGAGAFTLAV